jgi:hypothetical protein
MPRPINKNQPYDPVADAMDGGGGYYQMSLTTGLLAVGLAAAAPIFSFRWAPVVASGLTLRCQLKFFKLQWMVMTTFSTPQLVELDTFVAKSFTASDTGGNQIIPASGDQKRQKRYADSAFVGGGDIRISGTAALTAGTRTLEAQPFSSIPGWAAAAGSGPPVPIYEEFNEHHVPQVFEPNQGFVIANKILTANAGVIQFWIDIGWMEEYEPGAW